MKALIKTCRTDLASSRNFQVESGHFFPGKSWPPWLGCICSWGWCPHFESLPDYLHRGLRDRSSRIISDSCSPCTASPDGSFCTEEKRNALRTGDESGIPIFVPECREDGGYKQVQCHKGNNLIPTHSHTHLSPTTNEVKYPSFSRHWLLLVRHRGGKTSARIICSTFKGLIWPHQ